MPPFPGNIDMEVILQTETDRGYVEVDLGAITRNFRICADKMQHGQKLLAVIKANGYGHGAVPVARRLEGEPGLFGFAVATAQEAYALRGAGITSPILILGYVAPEHYERLIRSRVRIPVFRADQPEQIAQAAARAGEPALVHLAVDTGMGRIGVRPDEEGMAYVRRLLQTKGILAEGMFTHFAWADETDQSYSQLQLGRFTAFRDRIREETGFSFRYCHASNSAAILELPEAHLDLARIGITLYGLEASGEVDVVGPGLTPALSVKSSIVFLKTLKQGESVSYGSLYTAPEDRRVATIPLGYADGIPRGLSCKGSVLIRGQRCPILGRVCMDQFMVDVTHLSEVSEGDEVVLLGRQGDEEIRAEEIGAISGRFNYELVCLLTERLHRVYRE